MWLPGCFAQNGTTLFLNRAYPLLNPKGPRIGAKTLIACLVHGDTDPIGNSCDIAARILRDLMH